VIEYSFLINLLALRIFVSIFLSTFEHLEDISKTKILSFFFYFRSGNCEEMQNSLISNQLNAFQHKD